jgi:Na+/H+-translocating membrane pyrophosphatase
MQEYAFLLIFVVVFGIVILAIDHFKFYTCIAFIIGAATSTVSGYIGMYVATRANVRVTYMAATERENSKLSEAFKVAFKGGCVMGFCLVSLALAVFTVLIWVYQSKFLFKNC